MSWENWDRGQLEAPGHETAHSFRRLKKKDKLRNDARGFPLGFILCAAV